MWDDPCRIYLEFLSILSLEDITERSLRASSRTTLPVTTGQSESVSERESMGKTN